MQIKILNVDDHAASRYTRTQILRQAGYEVIEARTGHDAIELARQTQPSLVLLDVNLPDLSGFEVCQTIKKEPDGAVIPVLHVSATAVQEQDLITGLQAADAYLIEPVAPEVLLAFVRALLRGRDLLQQWVSIFDALEDGVALLNAEGLILRCNSAFCRLMGKRIGTTVGRSFADVVSATDAPNAWALGFERSLRSRRSETTELSFGESVYRLSSHVALVRGSMAGAVCIVSDVTAERRAARQREEAFAVLHALTDSAPVGFAFFDREMRYRFINKGLAAINGSSVEAHLGRTPEDVVPDLAGEAQRILQKVIETGQAVMDHEFTGETARAPGQLRYWSGSWYPIRSEDGQMLGVGLTVVETTDRKRTEAAQKALEKRIVDAQKLESIGLLAGGIAHDFNNLLTGILGNASLAQQLAPPGTTLARCLDEVIWAGERAAHLTKQMLAYSGKGRFILEPIHLSRELEEVLRLVEPSISKKIVVRLDLSTDLPAVRADRGQMRQVIMNLVTNAADAIGDRAGTISIKTGVQYFQAGHIPETLAETAVQAGTYVYVEVRDTGSGMDDSTKARIFDPFFTTKFTGRGLGLAAVGGILRGHQGAIQVSSAPGSGSTFVVLLPAATEPMPATAPEAPALDILQTPAGGTVLVVDDEHVVLRMAQSALLRAGYSVLPAESGPAAIELFRRHAQKVSLIILDLSMPGMSGQETLPELRKIHPHIPVLVSSGYSEAEAMRLFSGQQISGFLQKPYTLQTLIERVKAAVARQSSQHPSLPGAILKNTV